MSLERKTLSPKPNPLASALNQITSSNRYVPPYRSDKQAVLLALYRRWVAENKPQHLVTEKETLIKLAQPYTDKSFTEVRVNLHNHYPTSMDTATVYRQHGDY